MTINENVQHVIGERGWNRTISYQERLIEILSDTISETVDPERAEVVAAINAGKWDRNPVHFLASMKGSNHPRMLTQYSLADLQQMDTFKVPGYSIGFALKEHNGTSGHSGRCEIVAVHNNSNVKGIGRTLVQAAMANGGTTLDHFDGWLSHFYGGMGFEEYHRDAYDASYDQNGLFAKRYGKQPVIYRRLKKAPDVQ